MYKYSKHRKYKQNIEPRKYYAQCHKMEEYLASPYLKEGSIYWVGMNESCYNEYLREQNKLYEGLITTYPIENVIQELNDNYFDAYEEEGMNNVKIIVVYGVRIEEDDKEDEKTLLSIANKGGYILKEKVKSFDDEEDNHYDYYFVPKFAYECTKEAYLGDMCVYHLTNDYYIEKILKNGLAPKTKNKIENHPDRVYVAKEKNISKNFIRQMFLYMKNYKFKPIKYIYLLKIDLSKCEDKRFFLDPSAPDGMFTYENIPPQCISIEEKIDVNKL